MASPAPGSCLTLAGKEKSDPDLACPTPGSHAPHHINDSSRRQCTKPCFIRSRAKCAIRATGSLVGRPASAIARAFRASSRNRPTPSTTHHGANANIPTVAMRKLSSRQNAAIRAVSSLSKAFQLGAILRAPSSARNVNSLLRKRSSTVGLRTLSRRKSSLHKRPPMVSVGVTSDNHSYEVIYDDPVAALPASIDESSHDSRRYTVTHHDVSGKLRVEVANEYREHSGWYDRFMRDAVLAEFIKSPTSGEVELQVQVFVSGSDAGVGPSWEAWLKSALGPDSPVLNNVIDGAAQIRHAIFHAHLACVLEAIYHSEKVMLDEHPELLQAPVFVCYHGTQEFLPKRESWGRVADLAPEWREKSESEGTPINVKAWLEVAEIFNIVLGGGQRSEIVQRSPSLA